MIGGEFPISFSNLLKGPSLAVTGEPIQCYASGRAALFQIWRYLKEQRGVSRVLLPDYLCNTILVPIRQLALQYQFYPLDQHLQLQPSIYNNMYSQDSATLLINYFGLQDLTSQAAHIRSIAPKAIIIEDDVQAYYEFLRPLGDVDFKYTSLRKTFAIPDGGLVKGHVQLPMATASNTYGQYKAAAALMKCMRDAYFDDSVYLDISKLGGSKIDGELECGMSRISEKLYTSLDADIAKQRRQANAHYLVERLKEKGIAPLLPIPEDKVPLFVPITLPDRDTVRKRMFQHDIFCPVHWPSNDVKAETGYRLSQTELSLVIDQRYSRDDMDNIVSHL